MRVVVLLLFLLCLSACSTAKKSYSNLELGSHNFNYEIEQQVGTRLIQVFDSGKETYLHFLSLEELPAPKVYSGMEQIELSHRVENNFVVLRGVYEWLLVVVGNKESFVRRERQDEG